MPVFQPPLDLITIDTVLHWGPCPEYTDEKIQRLVGNGLQKTQFFDLEIPNQDLLWCLLHTEAIGDLLLHEFACAAAEHVLSDDCDPRSRAAIEAKRQWLSGQISHTELSAARAAASAAVRAAVKSAAGSGSAAKSAAWSAAVELATDSATSAAGWSAESAVRLAARPSDWPAAKSSEEIWQLDWLKNHI